MAVLDLIADPVIDERLDIVEPLENIITGNLRDIRDVEFGKQAVAELKRLRERVKLLVAAQRASEAIRQEPGNAAARLVLGEYLCFVKESWIEGLPYLAGSSDERFREIAANVLTANDDTFKR